MSKLQINSGDRYNMLTILNEVQGIIYNGKLKRKVLCMCDCGCILIVQLGALRSGHTTSCGCKQQGRPEGNPTHGLKYHPLYSIWCDMKKRCSNKNRRDYQYYGGRGIKVCNEWKNNFKQFYDDMFTTWTKGLTIDRIDNDGDYCKNNCRWATWIEQANNKRQGNGSKRKTELKFQLDTAIKIIVER